MTAYIILALMLSWCALLCYSSRHKSDACCCDDALQRFKDATGHQPNDADAVCLHRLGFDGYKAIGFDPSNAPEDVKRLIERL